MTKPSNKNLEATNDLKLIRDQLSRFTWFTKLMLGIRKILFSSWKISLKKDFKTEKDGFYGRFSV